MWQDEVQDKDNKAVRVSLVASAGSMPGSGTEYTEGDTDASITGPAIMWEDAGDTLRAVSAAKPLPVNVVSGGSSGTQYTEGDVDASITGTAVMWEDTGNTLRSVSASTPLPVGDGGGSLTIDGTVSISGSVAVTGPLTDAQLRASPVPVSGTVSATQGTSPWVVSGTVTVTDGSGPLTIDDGGGAISVDDNGGTISVDDGGGNISIDDGGNTITVDGAVSVSGSVTSTESQTKTDGGTGFVQESSTVFPVGAIFDDTAGTGLSENDIAAIRINQNRAQVQVLEDGSTRARYATVTAANALKVEANQATAANLNCTADTELAAASALSDTFSNPTTAPVGACEMYWDGTQWVRHRLSFSQTRNTVASGAGTVVDMSTNPMASFGIFVIKDGGTTLTAFTVLLEGSLDNANWTTLVSNSSVSGNPQLVWVASKPVFYMRSNVSTLTGSGSPTVKVVILAKEI